MSFSILRTIPCWSKVQRNSQLWQGYLFLTVTSLFLIYPGSLAWQWTKDPSQYLILLMKYDYIGSRFKQFPTKTDIEGQFLTLAEIFEGHWRQGSEKSIPLHPSRNSCITLGEQTENC